LIGIKGIFLSFWNGGWRGYLKGLRTAAALSDFIQ
jgi:hypothetical protein